MSGLGSFCVITIPYFPGKIVKITKNQKKLECRNQSQINAAHIIRENHFNRLMIPQAGVALLTIGKDFVPTIIEDKLPILNGNPIQLLQYYANHEMELENAIEQMTKFICMTKLADIKPNNLSLMFHPGSIVADILIKTDELRQSSDEKKAEIIPSNNEVVRKIISAINDEVSKKEEEWSNAVHGREWRLTMSRPQTKKTDFINTHFLYIPECLIPYLQEKGFVHSALDFKKSKDHNIHMRREIALAKYNIIVQF